MSKTILLTGATDGIGLQTARLLASQGHDLLLHGRNAAKLRSTEQALQAIAGHGRIACYTADLSRLSDTEALAAAVSERHAQLDVLINNAGVFQAPETTTDDGLDVRFAVNTIAPYLLTQRLLPRLGRTSRVVNVASAAQAPVELQALAAATRLSDMQAYSQSKLALIMWTKHVAHSIGDDGPVIVSVNPGSLLATKMVKEGFGVPGSDINIGAQILVRAALDDDFAAASGEYFDNDAGRFAPPHPDADDPRRNAAVVAAIDTLLNATT